MHRFLVAFVFLSSAPLRAEENERVVNGVYTHTGLGIRFSVPPERYEIRLGASRFRWSGQQCELESKDRWVGGILAFFGDGVPLVQFADWRERTLRTSGYRRLREKKGDRSLRREALLRFGGREFHYLHLFVVRGTANIELSLWVQERAWARYEKDLFRIVSSLEGSVWPCERCGAATESQEHCASSRTATEAPELLSVSRTRGIRIVTDPSRIYPVRTLTGHTIVGKSATREEIRSYAKVFLRELSRYPAETLRRLEIQRIVFARDLRHNGAPVGAVTDHDTDTLHLDVEAGRTLAYYRAEILHHELFHFIDRRDDGQAHSDPEWEKLNPPGFRYGVRSGLQWELEPSLKGFLNRYSMSRVQDDKAELFGFGMAQSAAVKERGRGDPILAAKLGAMKRLLERFSPALAREFGRPFTD